MGGHLKPLDHAAVPNLARSNGKALMQSPYP